LCLYHFEECFAYQISLPVFLIGTVGNVRPNVIPGVFAFNHPHIPENFIASLV
jgi:hypothetical protein